MNVVLYACISVDSRMCINVSTCICLLGMHYYTNVFVFVLRRLECVSIDMYKQAYIYVHISSGKSNGNTKQLRNRTFVGYIERTLVGNTESLPFV
jgi:hypothetical protein